MKNRLLRTFCAASLLLLASNPVFAQDVGLRLKANPTISGDNITLGDIFENVGDKSGQIIARAPSRGQNTIFAAPALQSRLNSMGLVWRNNEAVRQIIVRGAPSDRPQFGAAPSFSAPVSQKNGSPQAQLQNQTNSQNVQIAVLSREVQKDEVINANMLTWIDAPQNILQGAITEAESLVGTVAKRRILAGVPVKQNDIGTALAVRRGQPVTLIHEAGGLRISLRGRALSDGIIGGSIKAVNIASNKPLEAIVESDGVARVLMPSSSAQISNNRHSGAQISGF